MLTLLFKREYRFQKRYEKLFSVRFSMFLLF